ncbi:MoaA/NifB/PqqE/SkfB family radical SAM enzyme [Halanaerobium saccharolyticum]|uniref:MoaA/NifB/PqqE/SkfB family radical SAM enzyme n=1 Tax=Halanaerobium saccharolyticum TaxID=43595 RepID=A0A4R7Z0X7_9FIRM|nr:radical SAM protein [Halanaerobium saccharolyticum]RAK08099.1 MoaA/NifB/PqqE/SkfB family radical SAM enzyme [Halanaerobium saccharolyticum]TDW04306.1 MoaA/NifB/PqqE/SkfB family radical SAM enzyme [Halanaerobium saccharolyticum]TDX59597.1 MoaA/NifB/PqqE/SkfB family radical SAM enzyme [Halanaerobium saccharolyticum]
MQFLINNPQFWRSAGLTEELPEAVELKLKDGKLELPEELNEKIGLDSGTKVKLQFNQNGIYIERADPRLTRVYIEPTSDCNLNCKTCVRHSWDEEMGFMEMAAYLKLIEELKDFKGLDKISFWGIGEPLFHPQIAEMIGLASRLGVKTQIITNGLLLDQEKAEALLEDGLDSLVVSVDGTSPETMADIRSGADLKTVIENVQNFRSLRNKKQKECEIGIEYVIMKSNVDELKDLRKLAFRMGASFIFLTNLLPYTEDMTDEILYSFSISRSQPEIRTKHRPEIYLPPTDLREDIIRDLSAVGGKSSSISTTQVPFNPHRGYCKFIEDGSIAVNWQGEISPCIALMHSYDLYIREREKHINKFSLGKITEESLLEIWNKEQFKDFRKKVKEFPFSDCTQCSGCEMSKENTEDCHGNEFPVCGDCLWARGVIQCP